MILVNNIVWVVVALVLAVAVNAPQAKLFLPVFAGVGIAYLCMSARDIIEKALLP